MKKWGFLDQNQSELSFFQKIKKNLPCSSIIHDLQAFECMIRDAIWICLCQLKRVAHYADEWIIPLLVSMNNSGPLLIQSLMKWIRLHAAAVSNEFNVCTSSRAIQCCHQSLSNSIKCNQILN